MGTERAHGPAMLFPVGVGANNGANDYFTSDAERAIRKPMLSSPICFLNVVPEYVLVVSIAGTYFIAFGQSLYSP